MRRGAGDVGVRLGMRSDWGGFELSYMWRCHYYYRLMMVGCARRVLVGGFVASLGFRKGSISGVLIGWLWHRIRRSLRK